MIDEAAQMEGRDEAHWMENDALGMEDCPVCGGSGSGQHASGAFWNEGDCFACIGKGKATRRDAECLREAMRIEEPPGRRTRVDGPSKRPANST